MLRVLLAFLTTTASLPAIAQSLCADRSSIVDQLARDHREEPTALGLTPNGRVLEVLTSDDGTWTIIVSDPHGRTCLLAAGEAWQTVKRDRQRPGA